MSQSLAQLLAHIVFSTKNRAPFLSGQIRPKLFAYMAGTLNSLKCRAVLINGTENHVHILVSLAKDAAPSKIIERVKVSSSIWVKDNFPETSDFHWQNGYGLFSVSPTNAESVMKYISNQETHHKKITFEDEFRSILKKLGIKYDERYVWD